LSYSYNIPLNCIAGYENFDRIMAMLLGNPNLTGTIVAFFLDNTVPGNKALLGYYQT